MRFFRKRSKEDPGVRLLRRRGITLGSAYANRTATTSRMPETSRIAALKSIRKAMKRNEV